MSSEEISSSPKASDMITPKSQHAERVEPVDPDRKDVHLGVCQSGPSSVSVEAPTPIPPKKKDTQSNRCQKCRKKVGLTAVKCRCGNIYCAKHRYTNEHGCTFDYKALAAEELRKSNPQVVAEKVSKI